MLRRGGTIPWSLIETEVNRVEQEKSTLQTRLAELEETIAANAQVVVRFDNVVSLIDRLAQKNLQSATFDERVRILNDLGIGVRIDPLVWILDWLVPVRGTVEQDTIWRIDLSGVMKPTDEEREETVRFERQEALPAGGVPYEPPRRLVRRASAVWVEWVRRAA